MAGPQEFHHQIGHAVLCLAAVKELGNVRVTQVGEDLPFQAKALAGDIAVEIPLDDFDGDALVEFAIVAQGFKDCPLAALSDAIEEFVGTEAPVSGLKFGG